MDKISILKEIIVNLKMELVEKKVPVGYCPYTYYTQIKRKNPDCDDCTKCRELFMNDMRKNVEKEVNDI